MCRSARSSLGDKRSRSVQTCFAGKRSKNVRRRRLSLPDQRLAEPRPAYSRRTSTARSRFHTIASRFRNFTLLVHVDREPRVCECRAASLSGCLSGPHSPSLRRMLPEAHPFVQCAVTASRGSLEADCLATSVADPFCPKRSSGRGAHRAADTAERFSPLADMRSTIASRPVVLENNAQNFST